MPGLQLPRPHPRCRQGRAVASGRESSLVRGQLGGEGGREAPMKRREKARREQMEQLVVG